MPSMVPGFLNLGPEDETQVLVLVRQVFCRLSHWAVLSWVGYCMQKATAPALLDIVKRRLSFAFLLSILTIGNRGNATEGIFLGS